TRERPSVGSHQGLFAGRVDLRQQHRIGPADHLHKILEAVTRAGIAMWLEHQHDASLRPRPASRLKRGGHLIRMMTVVVHDGVATAAVPPRHFEITNDAETPANALEGFKSSGNFFVRD